MPNRWPSSEREYLRACKVIPGGVNSAARAFGAVGGQPILIAEGRGPFLIDIDGNEYLDYIGSWGPLILGHRHPRVVAAVEAALAKGTSFGAPTLLETELAERIVAAIASIEKVRMTNSGTEATMTAIRLARGFTGRAKIVKFAGCYHGHVDSLLVQAGSAATTLGTPSSPGVPVGCTNDTIVLDYNDVDAARFAFERHGDEIAAVILEPVVGNMGLVEPAPGYLRELRTLTEASQALLIFDEVITGFRLALGGAQERFDIDPDLTCLGKIIGGGMPVGAVGGRADIMDHLAPVGPVFQAGTLSGNPLAMACGAATLGELSENPPYETLERLSKRLANGIDQAASDAGIPHCVARVGSMLTLFFNPEPVTDYAGATRSDTVAFATFFRNLLRQGIYWPCSQYEALFVSAAHKEEHIDRTIAAVRTALAQIDSQR